MTTPHGPEAPLAAYDAVTDPHRAAAEAFYAAHDAAMAAPRIEVPTDRDPAVYLGADAANARRTAVEERQQEQQVTEALARHTLRYGNAQSYDPGDPYIPGKRVLGLFANNREDMRGLTRWSTSKALGRLVAAGTVVRGGFIPGFRNYRLAQPQIDEVLARGY